MTANADYLQDVRLPSMPEVAQTLIASLNEEFPHYDRLASAIRRDPALTAKLIRLANSARFGLPRKVASVTDAMTMVGFDQVRTLCLAASLSDVFPEVPGLDREAFWNQSMACAGFAQWLARSVGADEQQAWLTGFMVRLGELLIAQKEPGKLKDIEQLPHLPGGRWERELRLVGFTEGEVAAELARRWNFPEEIVVGLRNSPAPLERKPFSRLAAIVHLAMLLAELGIESDCDPEQTIAALPGDLVSGLKLDAGWMQDHLPQVEGFLEATAA